MKYIKARKDLNYSLNLPLILVGILLFAYASFIIPKIFFIFWIPTALIGFLIVTPLGNLRLGKKTADTPSCLPLWQWFFCILLLELAMFGVYYGICFVNTDIFTMNNLNHTLFQTSLHTQLLHNGLFPWNIYALVAVGMGIFAYREQTDAYFSQLTQLSAAHNAKSGWSLLCNVSLRRLTLFAISSTLLFMTLFFVSLFLSPQIHLATGFQINALLTTLILLAITFTKIAKKCINRIFSPHISTMFGFPLFCIGLGLLLLILSMLTYGLAQQTTSQTPPVLIERLIHLNPQTTWMIFSSLWWLSFVVLIASFIARISKGYQIRTVLLGVLILPIIFCILLTASHAAIFIPKLMVQIAVSIAFLIFLPMIINHRNIPNAILAYFPKDGEIKTRDIQPFFQKIVQLTIILLYFYLTIGSNSISLFIFVANYHSIFILFITSLLIIRHAYMTRK